MVPYHYPAVVLKGIETDRVDNTGRAVPCGDLREFHLASRDDRPDRADAFAEADVVGIELRARVAAIRAALLQIGDPLARDARRYRLPHFRRHSGAEDHQKQQKSDHRVALTVRVGRAAPGSPGPARCRPGQPTTAGRPRRVPRSGSAGSAAALAASDTAATRRPGRTDQRRRPPAPFGSRRDAPPVP